MRRWQLWTVVAWLVLEASMARAQSPADSVVEQLRAQGYVEVEVSRTLLGRIRVVAQAPDGGWREIVLNRGTGEILRDYSEEADGSRVPRILAPPDTATVVSIPDSVATISSPDADPVVSSSDSGPAVSPSDDTASDDPDNDEAAARPSLSDRPAPLPQEPVESGTDGSD